MYKVMVTGHRPQKLPVESINAIKLALLERVQALFGRHDDINLISGMALGVDTWFADIAIKLDIPFHAVLPFDGQDVRWRAADRAHYKCLLNDAKSIQIIASGFSRQSYFDRNTAMVEQSDECIAVWDGSRSGTSNAVMTANKLGVPVDRINPLDFTRRNTK